MTLTEIYRCKALYKTWVNTFKKKISLFLSTVSNFKNLFIYFIVHEPYFTWASNCSFGEINLEDTYAHKKTTYNSSVYTFN